MKCLLWVISNKLPHPSPCFTSSSSHRKFLPIPAISGAYASQRTRTYTSSSRWDSSWMTAPSSELAWIIGNTSAGTFGLPSRPSKPLLPPMHAFFLLKIMLIIPLHLCGQSHFKKPIICSLAEKALASLKAF